MKRRRPKPSDLAVALRYNGSDAPRVTASGRGPVAARIEALAREHGVPLQEDPQLAATLAQVPLGEEIPQALYAAVAEVLAFVYFLADRAPPRPDTRPADHQPPISASRIPPIGRQGGAGPRSPGQGGHT